MKKKIVSLLFLIFTEVLTSCSSVSQKDLTLLNGTWEIEEVQVTEYGSGQPVKMRRLCFNMLMTSA